MASVTIDDIKALDIAASGKQPEETNMAILSKMGLDEEDLKAWSLSKSADKETSERLSTKVMDKIRTKKEASSGADAIKATVAGAAQGFTFGWSEEAIAAAKIGFEKLTKGGDVEQIYKKRVAKERDELKRLEELYPVNFIIGELAGAIAVPIPGATALKGATIAGKAIGKGAQLATEAALTSAGKAEAPLLSAQFLEETGKGTLMGTAGGALLGKAGKKAGELIKKGEKPVKKAAQVVSNVLFDLPPAYTEKLLNQRTAEKILNPKSSEEIADSIIGMVKTMGQHARALSLKAQEKLSTKKSISVLDFVEDTAKLPTTQKALRSELPEALEARRAGDAAIKTLENLADKKGNISEIDLKMFIQDLDEEIPWNKLEWGRKENLLADIRSLASNVYLKGKNEEYKKAMAPLDSLMSNIEDISKSFSLKRKKYGVAATDATHGKIKSFFDVSGISKKPVTEKAIVEAEGRFFGPLKPTVLEDIELRQIATRTEGGMPAGSKHVLQGLAAGSLFGAPVWGAVAGGVKDRYGRKIGKYSLVELTNKIDFTDKMIQKGLDKINPELLDTLLRTTGRVTGAKQGVEAAQQYESPLLPRSK